MWLIILENKSYDATFTGLNRNSHLWKTLPAQGAGSNVHGRNVHSEPAGPNSTLKTDANGNQLYPGPGDNGFIDRPPACTQTTATRAAS